MADTKQVLDLIKEHDAKYVDFRFTDPRGKWQHLAHHVRTINDEFLSEGVPFDGSSIAGWKAINESDMLLYPDPASAFVDPCLQVPTLSLTCDIGDPITGERYTRDPRYVAAMPETRSELAAPLVDQLSFHLVRRSAGVRRQRRLGP
jgi:glutamine synthetase